MEDDRDREARRTWRWWRSTPAARARRGLGALLLERLIALAVARGAAVLRFCVLPTNAAMRSLSI